MTRIPTRHVGRLVFRGLVAMLVAAAVSVGCTWPPGSATSTPSATPSRVPGDDGTGGTVPPETPQRRLRMALEVEPATLDPAGFRDEAGRLVVDAVYDSLTAIGEDGQPRPSTAISWSVDEDQRTWTFMLRAGTRWHDDTPVVAGDFVRAFEYLVDDPDGTAFNAHLLDPLLDQRGRVDVAAPSDDRLVITLPEPFGDLPVLLAEPALAPRREGVPDPEQPVGNGPFRMGEPWAHNQFIRLAPVADHHEAPMLDEVLLPIYAQQGAIQLQYEDFRAGALDVAKLPVDQVKQAQIVHGRSEDGRSGPGVIIRPRATLTYLGFDTTSAPFDDPVVRRAISFLIDRDVLVAQLGREARLAATSIVPPGIPGGGQPACDHCRRDLGEALSLLKDRDEPLRDPIVLLTPDDDASRRLAESIVSALRGALDVPVALRIQPLQRYAEALAAGDFDLYLGGWTATRASMGGFLDPLLHSGSPALDNPGRIADPAVQDALEAAREAVTTSGRLVAWQRAEARALDAALLAPLYHPRQATVVGSEVLGFVMAPGPRVDLAAVEVPAG